MAEPILIAKHDKTECFLLPALANRHGLITGATGTGKTITLQTMAENFSRLGVPVFMADVKGDLTGITQAGKVGDKLAAILKERGIEPSPSVACPATLWDVYGKSGHPVRATVSDMGPLLLARMLALNDIQQGVLQLVFKIADDNGLLLLDLKDLRAMLQHVGDNASQFTTEYGNVSAASIGAIQRGILQIDSQGGDRFFGEPMLNIADFMQTISGKGVVNILAADQLMNSPQLYATFLLWMLSELFEQLPEVGDLDQPKLVFFFDEAHLLFSDAPKALIERIELVVRLVRSKGVGVYFVTQNPLDIPDSVLAQLGNRVQHALRAFTPRDQKAVKAAASTMRANPGLDIETAITELAVGEALVSLLDEKGRPSVTQRVFVIPPGSQIGPISAEQRKALIDGSLVAGVYEKLVDRESAYEKLKGRAAASPTPAPSAPGAAPAPTGAAATPGGTAPAADAGGGLFGGLKDVLFGSTGPRGGKHEGLAEAAARSAVRTIGSSVGREIIRGVLGGFWAGASGAEAQDLQRAMDDPTPLLPTPSKPRIELLGVPRLVLPQGKAHVLERRDAALLAWLALHGPTPRGRLVSLLWPDLPTRTAQTNLRQRLFRLKQRSGHEIVVSDPLLALADGVQHDLERTMPTQGDAIETRHAALLGALEYDDCGELGEWVSSSRERWDGERRKQLAQWAAELESQGRIAEALAYAERLTLEAPTAEHAHRRVMRLHYRRGDRSAALAAFERCREALARELGTRPGDETRELAALIERSDALPPPVAAPSPVSTLRPPQLIGREREWRVMEAAWQRRQPLLLLGEPGIGKSRLAADFAAAQSQAHTHRAHHGDARAPYSLLARLLRDLIQRHGQVHQDWIVAEFSRLLPELGDRQSGKLEPVRLRQAVVEAMAHWRTEGLDALVIDDLQYADEASLEWLLGWLEHRAGVRLLATVRSSELPPAMREWMDRHAAAEVLELAVLPLGIDSVASLVDSLAVPGLEGAVLADPLMRHTGGNPMFILETLRAGLPELVALPNGVAAGLPAPVQVGKLLERRLAQLSAQALRMARIAALSGSDFTADLAAQVLGAHVLDLSDAWTELERAQIIADGGFAHDLILEATQRSVPEAVAIALHRAIAEVLEAQARPPARVAHHWHLAGEWARAARQFQNAAEAAHRSACPAEALALCDRAAACYDQVDMPGKAFAARYRATDFAMVAEPADRIEARVEWLATAACTDAERLRALLARARHGSARSRFTELIPVSIEARAIARSLGDRRSEYVAANFQGIALTVTGDATAGLALFEEMAASVDEVGDGETRSEFCSSFGYSLHAVGRFGEAAQWFERAAEISASLGELSTQAIVLGNLSTCLGHLGQHEQALDAALQAHALQIRLGEIKGDPFAISLLNLGLCFAAAGRIGEALDVYRKALDLARQGKSETLRATLEQHVAQTYLGLGQPARARQVLTALGADVHAVGRARRVTIEWRIASHGSAQGPERLQQALDELGPRLTLIDRLGLELSLAAALPPESALPWSQRIRGDALASSQPTVALTALARIADAQRRLGHTQDSAASARMAVAEAAKSTRHDMSTPEFWWIVYQAFDAASCEPEACDALRTGAAWVSATLRHVPDEFRSSFLHRGPFVLRLMAAAQRRVDPRTLPA